MASSSDPQTVPSDFIENNMLNRLRAAVLGANDGIVSVSSVAMGVAGVTSDSQAIATAGLAALVAGALSMAVGEYVSVSSQSDAEKVYIRNEKEKLKRRPNEELHQLAMEYVKHGLSEKLAKQVATELTERDPLRAHLRMHFNINPDDVVSPWQAAFASLLAFSVGGAVPFVAVLLSSQDQRILMTVLSVVIALSLVGLISAKVGNAPYGRAVFRVVFGGLLAMALTYGIGSLFGTSIGA